MSEFILEEATIDSVHRALKGGVLTVERLVEMYLSRIEQIDRTGPKLNSVVSVNPHVLDEARALDREFARTGQFVGPLHGVPLLVKDQIETAGIQTTFGSVAQRGYVPRKDATAIAQLKRAGALVLAKTTMPDFATSWFGFSSMSGETLNPYDLARDSGGSSSGTAAGIAANLGLVGIGEDTGGSIRLPASFNNPVGVRVTPGLISRDGMSPLVVFQDTAGPMARTVTDAAMLLDCMVGYDPLDEYTVAHRIAGHSGSYAGHLDAAGLKSVRVGVLRQAFGSDSDPECAMVNDAIRGALEQLQAAGAVLVELNIPDLMEQIFETSLYLTHSRADLNAFLAARPELPYRSLDAIREAGQFHPVLDLLSSVFDGPERPEDDPDYFRKLAARERFQRVVVKIMADADVQALCYPAVQVPAPKKDDVRAGRTNTLTFPTNTLIASQTWMPSICLPAGFTGTGLPVGMELVVLPYHEPDLFRFGYAFEQVSRHRKAPVFGEASVASREMNTGEHAMH
ncbi:amidase [Paraburkholderia hospita]|uniref:amidase n=1 Tax=Paraburkholderia hospita TaxID=169430 RepID=UPI000B343B17|nr:amidase family protein [Paraburkholderia hospita]OUL72731.1 amidase [Paraburkholderia hospita]